MDKLVLELKAVNKSYQDGKEKHYVLKNATLKLREGEFAAVVGPSGSGKSTLLAISGMMLSPDSGSVYINGADMSKARQKEWTKIRRENIGFIFQNHQLLSYLRAEEQLALFQEKDKKDSAFIDSMMKELGIDKCREQFPAQMSGGEKQRVAVARAFINDPALILADEPTASLDSECGRQVVDMIRKEVKRQNKAAIMVTHDERVLDLVDTIYRLENGALVR